MSGFALHNKDKFLSADIFTHTMRFHPEIATQLMPQDTFSFTVIREPSSLFESIYNFYQLNSYQADEYKDSLSQFLEKLDVKKLKNQSLPLRREADLIGINQVSSFYNKRAPFNWKIELN